MKSDYLIAIARSPNFPPQLKEQAAAMLEVVLEVVLEWEAEPARMTRSLAMACRDGEWRKAGGERA